MLQLLTHLLQLASHFAIQQYLNSSATAAVNVQAEQSVLVQHTAKMQGALQQAGQSMGGALQSSAGSVGAVLVQLQQHSGSTKSLLERQMQVCAGPEGLVLP